MNYRLLLGFLSLIFIGCAKDPDMGSYSESDGKVFTLSIESFSDELVSSTRSSSNDDIKIKRGYVFFYNSATGAYKGYEPIENLKITQDESTVSFEVEDDYSTSDKIIAIFNHDADAVPSDFTEVTSANIDSYFPISSDYLSEVQEDMNSETYDLGMPMYLNDFTDNDRTTREVYRSVARMELFIKNGLTIEHESHTHSISSTNLSFVVVNDYTLSSSVGIGSSSASYTKDNCFAYNDFDGDFPYALTGYDEEAKDTQNKIYLHRFPYSTLSIDGKELDASIYDEKRFAIILKHVDQNVVTSATETLYYKLNLLDKVSSTYFDVTRNHSYRVVITAVNSRGYASVKEAYEMPPSNIEYEIYDDKGGLTYSNGQYAISMDEVLSYDEVLVYGSNATTLEFNNIRYVLPDGGQMESSDFDTNEITFKIETVSDGLTATTESNFEFDSDGKSTLTSNGQSISLTLSGEGECTIALKIKLGNLEMGRDEITIKKIATNGDGDGSFDAHPNHIEIEDQLYVDGTWQSDDIDFGARASSLDYDDIDGGTVVYMGENATPTGYRTMDGLISGETALNSYPVFSPKTRKGYYSYKDADGDTHKVMIQLEQLAPYYLGHFGETSTDVNSLYHYKGLICEKIEEVDLYNWSDQKVSNRNGVMKWSEATQTYYTGDIYGDFMGMTRYLNLVEGLSITKDIVEKNQTSNKPTAAYYCYMKNDVNGNGSIESDEPIVWYLPAQNQNLAMWINMNVFTTGDQLYRLNNDEYEDEFVYYWTASEADGWNTSSPSNFSNQSIAFNMLEGQSDYRTKTGGLSEQCHVRCVRDLE